MRFLGRSISKLASRVQTDGNAGEDPKKKAAQMRQEQQLTLKTGRQIRHM
jgi:hypothetical protein